jgi:hypothetical protein
MNKFVIDSVEYSSTNTAEYVFRDESTLGYCFINTGNCSVSINNYILLPNSSLKTFEYNMVDITRYQMLFNTFDACSVTNARLVVLIYSAR